MWEEKLVTERWFAWQTSRLSIMQFFLLQTQMLLRLCSAVSQKWKGIFSPYWLLVPLIHWSKYPCSWLQTEDFLCQWLMATLSQEEWLTPTCEYWRRYGIYLLCYLFWETDVCPHFFFLGINILIFSGRCECCNIPAGRKKPKMTASNLSDGNKLTVTNVKIVNPYQISYELYHLESQILVLKVPWQSKRDEYFLNGAYLLSKPNPNHKKTA